MKSTGDARIYPTTTHEVLNQSGAFVGVNVFDNDRILKEAIEREGAGWVAKRACSLGAAAADPEWQQHAYLANKHEPILNTHDRLGNRVDEVEFHYCINLFEGIESVIFEGLLHLLFIRRKSSWVVGLI